MSTVAIERGTLPALISVHDVMPETLPAVRELLGHLASRNLTPITILVVPGRSWTEAQVNELRGYQERGEVLAGHGWSHRADRIRGWRHRLHSALISRQAAEHLSLDRPEIGALISRCHAWFTEQGLGAADLYVPPAWAMGNINLSGLRRLPFRRYETLSGVYDAVTGRLLRLPLVGFEAHPPWRPTLVRLWNAANLKATRPNKPLRIGIHPYDLSLPLARDLLSLLDMPLSCRCYQDLQ
jgi:predicted deacetylase